MEELAKIQGEGSYVFTIKKLLNIGFEQRNDSLFKGNNIRIIENSSSIGLSGGANREKEMFIFPTLNSTLRDEHCTLFSPRGMKKASLISNSDPIS